MWLTLYATALNLSNYLPSSKRPRNEVSGTAQCQAHCKTLGNDLEDNDDADSTWNESSLSESSSSESDQGFEKSEGAGDTVSNTEVSYYT